MNKRRSDITESFQTLLDRLGLELEPEPAPLSSKMRAVDNLFKEMEAGRPSRKRTTPRRPSGPAIEITLDASSREILNAASTSKYIETADRFRAAGKAMSPSEFDKVVRATLLGEFERTKPFEKSYICCNCGQVFYERDVPFNPRKELLCPYCGVCHFQERS